MGYPYGQGQYGQDASMTGQQGQPASGAAPYGAQQQMPYGQMRTFHDYLLIFPVQCRSVHFSSPCITVGREVKKKLSSTSRIKFFIVSLCVCVII